MRKGFWSLLAVALFLSLGAKQTEKSYWAEHFDVTAEVLAGGDLDVHEQVVFNFQGGPFTFVFRELPTQATDGKGQISVSVRREPEHVGIEVSDNGKGIPAEDKDKVFAAFFSTRERGLGLGLALCKRIIDAHAGQITVRAAEGGGTVFSLLLPLRFKGSLPPSAPEASLT